MQTARDLQEGKEVGRIGGATMTVYTSQFAGQQKQIQLQLRGANAATLSLTAEQLARYNALKELAHIGDHR